MTLAASVARTASPIAGKMKTLFPCPGVNVFPLKVTGAKGLPLAKIAFPLLDVYACSAVHSERDVGFENGKMTGRSLTALMFSMT